jgi:hypothetical protein
VTLEYVANEIVNAILLIIIAVGVGPIVRQVMRVIRDTEHRLATGGIPASEPEPDPMPTARDMSRRRRAQ